MHASYSQGAPWCRVYFCTPRILPTTPAQFILNFDTASSPITWVPHEDSVSVCVDCLYAAWFLLWSVYLTLPSQGSDSWLSSPRRQESFSFHFPLWFSLNAALSKYHEQGDWGQISCLTVEETRGSKPQCQHDPLTSRGDPAMCPVSGRPHCLLVWGKHGFHFHHPLPLPP